MTEAQFNILNNHIGYGNSNAEIVFIGLEEGCKKHTKGLNYTYRYTNTNQLPTLSGFHLASPVADMSDWFALPKLQKTWGWYSKLMIHYLNIAISPLDYQLLHLGQEEDRTALLEFYPLPRKNHKYWDASLNIVGNWSDIPSYKTYCSDTFNVSTLNRIEAIKSIILENKKNKATIIHGSVKKKGSSFIVKREYDVILDLFGLRGNDPTVHILDNKSDGNPVIALEYRVQNKTIFFTHFFGNGAMTDVGINNLADLI